MRSACSNPTLTFMGQTFGCGVLSNLYMIIFAFRSERYEKRLDYNTFGTAASRAGAVKL
jgi:hypothetical protein